MTIKQLSELDWQRASITWMDGLSQDKIDEILSEILAKRDDVKEEDAKICEALIELYPHNADRNIRIALMRARDNIRNGKKR